MPQEREPTIEECVDHILSLPGYTENYSKYDLRSMRRLVGAVSVRRYIPTEDPPMTIGPSLSNRLPIATPPQWYTEGMDPPSGTVINRREESENE